MRTTIIPAQITSVEDKITSFLNLKQIVILVFNLIFVMIIFLIIPPFIKFSIIKMIFTFLLSIIIAPLSFKYRGVLLLDYLKLILDFKLRPKVYVLIRDDQVDEEINFEKKSFMSLKTKEKTFTKVKKLGHSYGYGKRGEVYVQLFK